MDRLELNWRNRKRLAIWYTVVLKDAPELDWPNTHVNGRHAYHLFSIGFDSTRQDSVIKSLQDGCVDVVVNYLAIHLLTYFQRFFEFRLGDFPVAQEIGDRTISLLFYIGMPHEHVTVDVYTLKTMLKE